jgi:hypothetical protein
MKEKRIKRQGARVGLKEVGRVGSESWEAKSDVWGAGNKGWDAGKECLEAEKEGSEAFDSVKAGKEG